MGCGHPRDLLRLASYCLQEINEGPITEPVARTAVRRLSSDYRRLMEPKDYELLARIDAADKSETPIDEQSRRLLYDLVLLEYDDFWWQSHSAVRDLPGYATAAAKIEPASPAGGLRGPDAPGVTATTRGAAYPPYVLDHLKNYHDRDRIIERLADRFPHTEVWPVSPDLSAGDFIKRLGDFGPEQAAVQVVGLEDWPLEAGSRLFSGLNYRREDLAAAVPFLLVVWLLKETVTRFE